FHILLVITAVGSNITDGIWQGRAGNDPEHESFVLRGVKLPRRPGRQPGVLARAGDRPHDGVVALVLYHALDRCRHRPLCGHAAASRATTFGIAVMVPILAILRLMVTKPSL